MPLNEDELRKVFEAWFRPTRPLLRDENGEYIYMAAHSAWQTFKAAYSPEVLQALGVVLCDAEPAGYQVISNDNTLVGAFARSEFEVQDLENRGLYFPEDERLRPLHAIKEQS